MKKLNLFSTTIVLLIVFQIISSQTAKAQNEFGVKTGVNYTGINNKINSLVFDFDRRSGLQFGVFYKMNNLLGPVGLQTEFMFQQKGGNFYIRHSENGYAGFGYDNPASGYWLRRPQRYNYLSIPLLLTVTPIKFLDIYAGPEIGYLINSNAEQININWDANRFAAGISAGVAFKVDKNTKLDVRYSTDLTRVADMGDTDIKNYGWAFSIQRTLFNKQK